MRMGNTLSCSSIQSCLASITAHSMEMYNIEVTQLPYGNFDIVLHSDLSLSFKNLWVFSIVKGYLSNYFFHTVSSTTIFTNELSFFFHAFFQYH